MNRQRMRLLVAISVIIISSVYAVTSAAFDGLGQVGLDYRKQLMVPVRALFAGYDVWHPATSYFSRFQIDDPAALHPPSAWLLGAPFAALPAWLGYTLWILVSVGCLWTAVLLLGWPYRERRWPVVLLVGAVIVCGGPANFALALGQWTPVVALGLALVLRFPRHVLAAVGIALLTITPQTAIPVSVALLAAGRRREVGLGWLASALLSLPFGALEAVNAGVTRVGASVLWSIEHVNRHNEGIDALRSQIHLGPVEALLFVLAMVGVAVVTRRGADTQEAVVAALALSMALAYHQAYDLVVVCVALAALTIARSLWWLLPIAVMGLVTEMDVVRSFGAADLRYWQDSLTTMSTALGIGGAFWLLIRLMHARPTGRPEREITQTPVHEQAGRSATA